MKPTITVETDVSGSWLPGQTKGSAEIEITFGGVVASEPIHIGFAVQQVAQARAAADVLASFFLLLARDTATRADDRDCVVTLGDQGRALPMKCRPICARSPLFKSQ